MLNNVHDTTLIEDQQKDHYPGLRVRRDGDAVVVHVPMRMRRRNGQCMVVTEGETVPVSAAQHVEDTSGANRTLIEAIAKGHRWQAQLESGEYPSLEDLAHAVGCDRTYVGRMLRLTSLAPDIIEAILKGDEPKDISLAKLRKKLPMRWDEQRTMWLKRKRAGLESPCLR